MRGRKPKPTALKIITGKPGHRPLNDDEPTPEIIIDTPEYPAHLSGEARAEWNRLYPILARNGMISEADLNSFAGYCQAYGRWQVAESYIAQQGEVLIAGGGEGKQGMPIQNPYLAVSNKAQEYMLKREIEFGMTPSSRSRVSATAARGGKIIGRFERIAGIVRNRNIA